MRYKVGWFIPQQVIALTHFVPEVTPEDFSGIISTTNACLQKVRQPFNLIIDNRIIKSEQVVSLDVILQTIPQLQQVPLRQIIMILPRTIEHQAAAMEIQRRGAMQMCYVGSLAAALAALRAMEGSLNWDLQVSDFFVEDGASPQN